ncbi:MAG: transketolase, partial [Bacteroidota bacterium]
LEFEEKFDCNRRMAEWMLESGIATPEEVEQIKVDAKKEAAAAALRAYRHYHDKVAETRRMVDSLLGKLAADCPDVAELAVLQSDLAQKKDPLRYDVITIARRALAALGQRQGMAKNALADFISAEMNEGNRVYSSNLLSSSPSSPMNVASEPARYTDESPLKDGFEILNACFDHNLSRDPRLFIFGEDVGFIGDVNQGLRGMQQKYGEERVFDTGIREWTIMGQAIGMAIRGLRPIAEIQYLDYLLYGLSPLSDDLCTLRWRSNNLQAAPAIIRTRGHRLVGVWHSGSPMGMMLGSLRGMHVCVPRNMTQAAGMYNTLLQGDDPAIVVEVLNGYRLKERLPDNIAT